MLEKRKLQVKNGKNERYFSGEETQTWNLGGLSWDLPPLPKTINVMNKRREHFEIYLG